LLFIPAMGFAQDEAVVLKAKDYSNYLPQVGDISIGADALPYLEFLGNMFNNTEDNTLDLGENTLYFKYFLTDNTAVRAIISINNNSTNERAYVADDKLRLNPLNPNALAEDLMEDRNRDMSIKVGYQIYKTRKRLAGYYGAQIGYGYGKSSNEFTYANPYTAMNQTPSSYNFDDNAFGSSRILESTSGTTSTISAGVFIGVEYFFMPKISIGGEYALDFQHSWSGQSNGTSESWNGSSVVKTDTPVTPQQSSSSFATSRPATYGGLFLSFYF